MNKLIQSIKLFLFVLIISTMMGNIVSTSLHAHGLSGPKKPDDDGTGKKKKKEEEKKEEKKEEQKGGKGNPALKAELTKILKTIAAEDFEVSPATPRQALNYSFKLKDAFVDKVFKSFIKANTTPAAAASSSLPKLFQIFNADATVAATEPAAVDPYKDISKDNIVAAVRHQISLALGEILREELLKETTDIKLAEKLKTEWFLNTVADLKVTTLAGATALVSKSFAAKIYQQAKAAHADNVKDDAAFMTILKDALMNVKFFVDPDGAITIDKILKTPDDVKNKLSENAYVTDLNEEISVSVVYTMETTQEKYSDSMKLVKADHVLKEVIPVKPTSAAKDTLYYELTEEAGVAPVTGAKAVEYGLVPLQLKLVYEMTALGADATAIDKINHAIKEEQIKGQIQSHLTLVKMADAAGTGMLALLTSNAADYPDNCLLKKIKAKLDTYNGTLVGVTSKTDKPEGKAVYAIMNTPGDSDTLSMGFIRPFSIMKILQDAAFVAAGVDAIDIGDKDTQISAKGLLTTAKFALSTSGSPIIAVPSVADGSSANAKYGAVSFKQALSNTATSFQNDVLVLMQAIVDTTKDSIIKNHLDALTNTGGPLAILKTFIGLFNTPDQYCLTTGTIANMKTSNAADDVCYFIITAHNIGLTAKFT